jgi:ergothioneine biosynthesis protein EgtB
MAMQEMGSLYAGVRATTLALAAPLTIEDQLVQPFADASPTKWHLAHTTWFFEELVLGDVRFDPAFRFLFNSYYEAIGPRVDRARRGLLSRPSHERVLAYRADVDARIERALATGALDPTALARLELGLHHEQQHQELLLTDAKAVLAAHPQRPPYRSELASGPSAVTDAPLRWREIGGGLVEIGAPATGFAFDNERPRHRTYLEPFALASRPITNGEVLGFIAEGGYREPRLWLSDGWQVVQREDWRAPLYWNDDGTLYGLGGDRVIDRGDTACHLSYYEADAIARWLGARLPTEAEWEVAAASSAPERVGEVWEWTSSAYAPYPGFRPLAGALAEYNGKFMSGQYVLRGGSCLTPRGHVRASYRNFFPPTARWQMTGARLARDVS